MTDQAMTDQIATDQISANEAENAAEPAIAVMGEAQAARSGSKSPPFRFLIPILLVLLVPLMHGTAAGEALLLKTWFLVGLGGAAFALLVILSGVRLRAGSADDALGMAAWALLLGYLLHQFEEFGIDLYGNFNAFPTYMGAVLAERFPDIANPLTEHGIYRVNTIGIWVLFLLAIWAGHRLPWVGLAAAGIMFTNACVHIGLAFMMREYNPGLATAVLLFLPLSLRYFIVSNNKTEAGWGAALLGVAFGASCHAFLPTVLAAASSADWSPSLVAMFTFLVGLPIVANIIARLLSRS